MQSPKYSRGERVVFGLISATVSNVLRVSGVWRYEVTFSTGAKMEAAERQLERASFVQEEE